MAGSGKPHLLEKTEPMCCPNTQLKELNEFFFFFFKKKKKNTKLISRPFLSKCGLKLEIELHQFLWIPNF